MSKVSTRNGPVGIIAIVLIIGLGACAPVPIPTPTVPPPTLPPTTVPTATPPPTATTIPTATSTPFVPKAVLVIVAQLPADTHVAEGAQLAVEQLAGPLRELGYQAQFKAYDDQNNVDVALRNAREFIDDPQVLCGVGHYYSSVTLSMADVYHGAGLAMISPSNTIPKVSQLRYVEINRVSGREDGLGVAAAKFVEAQGLQSIFIVRGQDDPGNPVVAGLKNEANNAGILISGDEVANPQRGNVEATAARVVEVQPDAVAYSGGPPNEAGAFFKQARLAGYRGMLLDWTNDPATLENAGATALQGAGLYEVGWGGPDPSQESGTGFIENFQSTFGEEPPVYAAEAYDAAGICLNAIEEASRAKEGELPTRQEVAQAVRNSQDYAGITGNISFDEHGDRALVRYYVKQITSADVNNWPQSPIMAILQLPPPN